MCQKLEWFKQEPDDTLGYKFISFSLKASSLKNGLYLGIIWLGNYFWLLFQKLGEFFQSSGHPGPNRAMFSFCTKDLHGRMYVALGMAL
jgi:hypothetical protein